MRLKLLLAFALVLLVAILSVVVITRYSAARELRNFLFSDSAAMQEMTTDLQDYYQANQTWTGAESLLHLPGRGRGRATGTGTAQGGVQVLRLADASGNVVYQLGDSTGSLERLNAEQLDQAVALVVDGETVGYLHLEGGSGYSPGEETFLVDRLTQAAVTAALLAGGLALLLALLLAYQLARPIQALTRASEQLAMGDLDQRVQVSGRDEVGRLASTFNQMAASLQQAQQSRKAMTADIAHELRTPLAVQRAHLEALEDGLYPLTIENLETIRDQNVLLTRLVEDLRTLALADAGQLDLQLTPTELPGLVQRIVERYEPQAAARKIRLLSELPETCPELLLDPMRVQQVLGNLLSNALRHTPEGGEIRIQAACRKQQVVLSVHDSGAGIPPEGLPHVFERFYRLDKARQRSDGGTGLGLAIARHLTEAMSGSISAQNHPQGGALFTLTFPIPPAAPK